jgi:hypothetical protein
LAAFLVGGFLCFGGIAVSPILWEAIAWSDARVAESRVRGEGIVKALDAYYVTRGFYPRQLEELQPAYLKSIQRPSAGDRAWLYEVAQDAQSFTLVFAMNEQRYPAVFYESEDRVWYDDK